MLKAVFIIALIKIEINVKKFTWYIILRGD